MSPYNVAFDAFHKEPTILDWYKVLDEHLHGDYGFIIKKHDFFVCAREVGKEWPVKKIVDDCHLGESSTHLHVSIVAGDLKQMVKAIPRHIKTISFQKNGYDLHNLEVSSLVAKVGA